MGKLPCNLFEFTCDQKNFELESSFACSNRFQPKLSMKNELKRTLKKTPNKIVFKIYFFETSLLYIFFFLQRVEYVKIRENLSHLNRPQKCDFFTGE